MPVLQNVIPNMINYLKKNVSLYRITLSPFLISLMSTTVTKDVDMRRVSINQKTWGSLYLSEILLQDTQT